MLRYIYLTFILLIIKVTSLYKEGACPIITHSNTSFDLRDFMGTWHEAVRSKNTTFETGLCVDANYTLRRDGSFSLLLRERTENGTERLLGRALPTNNPFRFKVAYGVDIQAGNFNNNYIVLATDYVNYAIVYSCTNLENGRDEYVWLLYRNREYSQLRFLDNLEYLRKNFDISSTDLVDTRINCR
jgi:lipocalin